MFSVLSTVIEVMECFCKYLKAKKNKNNVMSDPGVRPNLPFVPPKWCPSRTYVLSKIICSPGTPMFKGQFILLLSFKPALIQGCH